MMNLLVNKYKISASDFLATTAPYQAAFLMLVGPVIDRFFLAGSWPTHWFVDNPQPVSGAILVVASSVVAILVRTLRPAELGGQRDLCPSFPPCFHCWKVDGRRPLALWAQVNLSQVLAIGAASAVAFQARLTSPSATKLPQHLKLSARAVTLYTAARCWGM